MATPTATPPVTPTTAAKTLNEWARAKFGALVDEYKPSTEELAKIEAYYRQHPGAPQAEFVILMSASRAKYPTQSLATASDAKQTPAAAAAAKKAAPKGSLQKQIADALKNAGGQSSAVLDQFSPTTPVYIVGTAGPQSQIPTPGGQHKIDPTGGITASNYQDVMTGLYKMDAATLHALKQQLWDNGYYPAGTDKSVLDSPLPDMMTRTAYTIAVQQAARLAEAGHKTTVTDVILGGNPDPSKSTGAAALGPYTITNPADLKAALNSVGQERLGRDLSKDEIATFAKLYQGMEAQSSLRAQAAGRDNQQVGIVAPPSPTAGAQDYLDQHFAAQEQGYGAVQRQAAFFQMLGPIV